jgi:hypothetical protein
MNQKKLMDLVDTLVAAAREAGRCEIEEENGNCHSALDLADREVLELRERILQTLEGGNAQS